jgi:hypothetical protein
MGSKVNRKIEILRLVPEKPERKRLTAKQRGYDQVWKRLRDVFLSEHPLCMCDDCANGQKRLVQATVVDHCRPIEDFPHLRLEWDNLRSMAKICHDRHTMLMNTPEYRANFFQRLDAGQVLCGATVNKEGDQ